MREPLEVAVCVIRKGRKFLIAQRSPHDSFGGFWEFPGGKQKEEESLEDCATREAAEEVGIDLEIERPLRVLKNPYGDPVLNLHFFMCSAKHERLVKKSRRYRWVDVTELKKYKFPPANDEIITFLSETYAGLPRR